MYRTSGIVVNREFTVSMSRTKSFVDDLGLGRGVVLIRAATLLRSIETKPWTGRFVCFRQAFRTIVEQIITPPAYLSVHRVYCRRLGRRAVSKEAGMSQREANRDEQVAGR